MYNVTVGRNEQYLENYVFQEHTNSYSCWSNNAKTLNIKLK